MGGAPREQGYFDAGDYVKYGQPAAYTISVLSWGALEFPRAFAHAGALAEVMDAVRWGADFILKAASRIDDQCTYYAQACVEDPQSHAGPPAIARTVISLPGLYLAGNKNAYPLPAYGMKPEVLEMPPKTLAESPYAAKDGFAAVKAAAPCACIGGLRINFVRVFSFGDR